MILLRQLYNSESKIRQEELEFVKSKNSKIFEDIKELKKDKRITFRDFFIYCKEKYKGEICVVANNDIIFNETIHLINKIIKDNLIIALTRWEDETSPFMFGDEGKNFEFYSYSQDVWAFKAGSLKGFKSDFRLGIPKCENRLAFEAVKKGIEIINPSLDIKTFHHHKSNIRTWKIEDSYEGPLYFPKITTIENREFEGLVEISNQRYYHKNKNFWEK